MGLEQSADYDKALELAQRCSPYLTHLLAAHPDIFQQVIARGPSGLCGDLAAACAAAARLEDSGEFKRQLRFLKGQAALTIALADLAGAWDVADVTRHLTAFADAALQATVHFLLRQAGRDGKLSSLNESDPSRGCGYVVLAMGKHGAFELNYSSDIDLIVLYDPETAPLADGVEPSTFFVRFTRNLVTLLQDLTEDGYVFRVDLRLRPDPRATQVAIAIEAAAIYYENLGQNWERAAMIKARPAAGDIDLGREFLGRLKSYVWRKYLDFAAIADVQSLKRQIHAVKGHGEIAVMGHNLKLGRGGIREIEFFVQTQQLIAGGRNPALRGQQTVPMLWQLAEAKWITPDAARELADAYGLLRKLEHRVQMINDAQDHCVPATAESFENFSRFSGFGSPEECRTVLTATLETVQRHYQALFESAEELSSEAGNLVFTGGEDDPGTLETLVALGFRQASEVSATIRGWHFGRYNATRTKRSRELLTELMPSLLKALAATGDADHAFLAFDRFLQGLPAGVQLFSMLKANPSLLDLLARILGAAPRLANQLSRQPRILEAVLDPRFFGPLPSGEELAAMTREMMPPGLPLEEVMDRARTLGREQNFRVGVRILSETVSEGEAGAGFSNVADALLARVHAAVVEDMQRQHGTLAGAASAIVAMGKLGGREMTAGSDLDLMLVYDYADPDAVSDGSRPLSAPQYFARVAQRLVTAITAPTAEGVMYEVDMRLRPSGSKGPMAVSFASFQSYQAESAWTWEKMALTRARIVSATGHLAGPLRQAIAASLCAPRAAEKVKDDARDMRILMLREHTGQDLWDLKRKRGGLVEVEFIAQCLQLIHAANAPEVLDTNTGLAIERLARAHCLGAGDSAVLSEAFALYGRMTQMLRLCLDGPYDPDRATPALNEAVCRAARLPDLSSTTDLLGETAEKVKEIFDRLIGPPVSA